MPAAKPKPKPKAKPVPPTVAQFRAYQAAWDYFNRVLFGGELRPCLLVFRDGRPVKGGVVLGHFAWDRWENAGGELCHEISLNPQCLKRPIEETFGTLVHEMVHQWQQDHGRPPRAGYHDRQWAAKMAEVGLVASATGEPGGKPTGQRMTHYPAPGGPFLRAVERMPASVKLPWVTGGSVSRAKAGPEAEKRAKKKNKVRYTCPGCDAHVWGKAGLAIACGDCDDRFGQDEKTP
jgi:predicted SprT family Zn-dependent metalloprotease